MMDNRSGLFNFILAVLILFILPAPVSIQAQNASYSQIANELQFARAINDKWAGEVFLGGTFSNTPNEDRVIKTNIQRYIYAWVHYYYSPRWKFTGSLAYFYNKDVPDIGQYLSPEYRLSLQATYYIHKTGYTLFTRMRGELRYMMNADGDFEDKYRYRQMIKFVKPINSMVMRQGVAYGLTSEELLFKPQAKTKGINFIDRNRFEIGAGYLITDNISIELAYQNEFMPRDEGNQTYNILAFTFTFNNLASILKNKFKSKPAEGDQSE
jgi:hypothetical protein